MLATPLKRLTPYTVSAPGILLQELARARELGYAVENEQTKAGFVSVAIPLIGTTGAVTGALSVTAPVFRADVQKFAGLLNMVGRRIMKSVAALSQG